MIAVEMTPGTLGEILDIEGRLQRNPYGMVAGAVAVGFVLGGGLFTRLTATDRRRRPAHGSGGGVAAAATRSYFAKKGE